MSKKTYEVVLEQGKLPVIKCVNMGSFDPNVVQYSWREAKTRVRDFYTIKIKELRQTKEKDVA